MGHHSSCLSKKALERPQPRSNPRPGYRQAPAVTKEIKEPRGVPKSLWEQRLVQTAHPTLLTAPQTQQEQPKELRSKVSSPQDTSDTHAHAPPQSLPPPTETLQMSTKRISRRLYSMAELLAQQDLELAQERQAEQRQSQQQQPLHPKQMGQAQQPQQIKEMAEANQQHADAYALQQGLQIARQQQVQPRASHPPYSRFAEVPNTVPLAAGVERVDPMVVSDLLKSGRCVLVDVRGDDCSSGTIAGAVNVRAMDNFLGKVPELVQLWKDQPVIIFHCQYSAHRAPTCANWYKEQTAQNQRVAIMDGGFRGWESTGLPVLHSVQMPLTAAQQPMQLVGSQ